MIIRLGVLHPEFAKDPAFAARFLDEARAVNLADHPGLVQISDYGRMPDGTAYIVMEYLKGETLGARLRHGNGKLPVAELVNIAILVAEPLAAAHDKGIVHRDLKPDKITPVEKWLGNFRRPSEKAAEVFVTHWLWSKHPKRRSKQDHQTWISG